MRTTRRTRRDPRRRVSLQQFRREVVALLRTTHRISTDQGIRLVGKHNAYVNAAWAVSKEPCYVADNIARKEHGVTLSRRDPENPNEGEVYESKAGTRWEVVGVDRTKKRVKMRRKGSREVGDLTWNPSVLRSMKQLRESAAQEVKQASRVVEQEGPPEPSFREKPGLFASIFGKNDHPIAPDPSGRAPSLRDLTTSQLRFLYRQRKDPALRRLIAAELRRRSRQGKR